MDTSTLENIAESLISHKLQHYKLLVAKPMCDRLGTDLLVFSEISDNVKFCRIQAKGRSFANSKTSNIKIPKEYVTNGFLVFLYLEFNIDDQELYLFFPSDIRKWKTTNGNYKLDLYHSQVPKYARNIRKMMFWFMKVLPFTENKMVVIARKA